MRFFFELRYLLKTSPWDTGISPPELMEFIHEHAPGDAIDLGCGTGTNSITLAKNGWKVLGIDFSYLAIRRAKSKNRSLDPDLRFVQGDVTRLENISGPFDFALDIGCYHILAEEGKLQYIRNLSRVLRPSASYLMYSWLASETEPASRTPRERDILAAFGPNFEIIQTEYGTDRDHQSAWFEMRHRS